MYSKVLYLLNALYVSGTFCAVVEIANVFVGILTLKGALYSSAYGFP